MLLEIAVLFLLVGILVSVLVGKAYSGSKAVFEKISSLPEPKGRTILGHFAPLYKFPGNERINKIRDWFDDNGSTVKLMIKPFQWAVGTRDLAVIRTVYVKEDVSKFHKGSIYDIMRPWLGDGILMSEGENWHHKRKMMNHAFSAKSINNLIPTFTKCTVVLLDYLKDKTEVDLSVLFTKLTLDIIGSTSFSFQFNSFSEEGGLNEDFLNILNCVGDKLANYVWMPVPMWLTLTKSGRSYTKSVKILHQVSDEIIKKRMAEKASRSTNEDDDSPKDLLDHLIEAVDNGQKFSAKELRDEIMTFLFAGHDTTSSALTFSLYHIASHKDVEKKICDEVDALWKDIDPKKSFPTVQDITNLTYTTMVLKESMRVLPPVLAVSRKCTSPVFIPEYNFTIPPQADVNFSIGSVHSDPKNWGEKAREFNPENFSTENSKSRDPSAFCPFSVGPRNCIGQYFAMVEARIILALLYKYYTFDIDPRYQIIPEQKVILKPKNGAKFIVKKRE